MLWSACKLVAKHLGETRGIRQQIARLPFLRSIKTPTVEISVSAEYACNHCHRFKELLTKLTGIQFVIKLPPTLAEIPRVRNDQGKKLHPAIEIETPKHLRYRQELAHLIPAPIEPIGSQMHLHSVARPETPKLTKSRENAVDLLTEVARSQLDIGKFAHVESITHSSAKKRKYRDIQDSDTESQPHGSIHRHGRAEFRPARERSISRNEFQSTGSSLRHVAPDLVERARRPYRRV